jgi:hypothetical protein
VLSRNFRLGARNRQFILKCRLHTGSAETLSREAQLAAIISQKGVPVPKAILSDDRSYAHVVDNHAWLLYAFQTGDHFTGQGRELAAAADTFAHMSKVVRAGEMVSYLPHRETESSFIEELPRLLHRTEALRATHPDAAELVADEMPVLLQTLHDVTQGHARLVSDWAPQHTDYHPLNLLMKDEKVACVLDMEDIKPYPVLPANGFAAYKLIRQMMVNTAIRQREERTPTLAQEWLSHWTRYFSSPLWTVSDLGLGAAYRVLSLICIILDYCLNKNNPQFLFDLSKQIGSLHEINRIFLKERAFAN